jgi:hypothetical protein
MKLFDKIWDADDSLFTKILSVVSVLFGVFCSLWLVVASYGIGNTKLAQAHAAGHGGSETIFATLIYAAAGFWIWINVTDRVPFRVSAVAFSIITLLLIILGVNANTGFFAHVY